MMKNSIKKINEFIENKYFTGASLIVSKNKQIIFKQHFGLNDVNLKTQFNDKTLFRAYSMTKPLTVIAFLILVQQNKLNFDTLLEDIFPCFKNQTQLVNQNSKETQIVNQKITMHHLLTMTAGMTYHGNKNQTQIETAKFIKDFSSKKDFWDYETFCNNLSQIPLLFEPGSSWHYGLCLDVISAVVEKVSQQKFSQFIEEQIFNKLNMLDSGFYVKDKTNEAKIYNWSFDGENNKLDMINDFNFLFQDIYQDTPISLGGAGLITTALDYNKFLNFLLDGKDENQKQILDFKFIKKMSQDQLKDLRQYFKWTLNEDYSYGYGVRVRIENESYPKTQIGEFGWDGLLGSTGLVDPKNKITMNLMLSSKPGHNKMIESEFFDSFYKDVLEIK
ncbi:serine hydrolase domain-containing protein [Spiroplasma culicicola]|uniref:Transmembrane protein n=1 Tax=Spiroplasma culicicola AES-1 TaxID=1276246 RepID=W6A631_9MOLU|nr:serine hydrolase domain-containing protein [Spiroplasma culicicola]AHI52452.1 transmembrane protein [Spiroplasma culicicola AES-1]